MTAGPSADIGGTMEYILAGLGLALMLGLSGAGSAIRLAAGGSSVLGMIKKRPEAFGNGLVLSGLPATQGLYGFVAFILYSGNISDKLTMFQAAVIFDRSGKNFVHKMTVPPNSL